MNKSQWEDHYEDGVTTDELHLWISPEGKIFDASESGHTAAALALTGLYGVPAKYQYNDLPVDEIENNPPIIKDFLITKGWIRILKNTIQLKNWNELETLRKGLLKINPSDLPERFNVGTGANDLISIPTKTLQTKGINIHTVKYLSQKYQFESYQTQLGLIFGLEQKAKERNAKQPRLEQHPSYSLSSVGQNYRLPKPKYNPIQEA